MKASAITRIIIFSIVILILLGVLLVGLGISVFSFATDFGTGNSRYNTAQSQVTCPAADIRNMDIEWAVGKIILQTADTDTVTFSETGGNSEDHFMVWSLSNGTLSICYEEPRLYFGITGTASKDLILTVPQGWSCDNVNIQVASAQMQLEGLNASSVEIDTASGECSFIECNIGKLDVDTASGFITYSGSLNRLDCDAASGSFEGSFTNTPERIQMDSASGDLE